jgi:PAS domain S-box-containing protein
MVAHAVREHGLASPKWAAQKWQMARSGYGPGHQEWPTIDAMDLPPLVVALVVAASVVSVCLPAVLVRKWRDQARLLQHERERLNALFQASVEAQASTRADDVEAAICRGARGLLAVAPGDSVEARIDRIPPGPGELGARLRSAVDPDRWLTVRRRSTDPAFVADDGRVLELLVAATAAALDNALLYDRIQGERQRLADLIGSSSDGIFSFDAEGVVTSWNPAMSRITRLPSDRALERPCDEVFTPLDDDGAPVPRTVWLERAALEDTTFQVPVSGGDRRWLDCACSPMPDGGVVVVARDISAQREVEELKADFLATVSHELRTPLTPIQGFLQTLLHEDANFGEAERRRFFEVMLRQSNRLERLINDLLDATTLQDRAHLFFPEEIDWTATAERVLDLFRNQEPGREFRLVVDHAGGSVPAVVADEQRAEQVLSNLLANAVKYSPPGEAVEVVVGLDPGGLRTTVIDRGPGVPADQRDRVFDRFTRLGNHLTRPVGGAGLGLFIARRLVEGMGGELELGDAPGGGAAFTFTLPVSTTAKIEQVAI